MAEYDVFQVRDMFIFNLWSKVSVSQFWASQWSL